MNLKKIFALLLAFVLAASVPRFGIPFADNSFAAYAEELSASSSQIVYVGPRGSVHDDPADGIYVSTSGNDSTATGSIGAPYKSINAALSAAEPGSTIILRGGTYREGVNVRIRKPNVTIKSAKGEWAVIDLTVYDAGCDEDSGVYFDVDSSGGKLQSVEVKGGFYAVCTETRWDWGDPSNRRGASDIIIEDCVLHESRYDVVKIKPNCKNVIIRNNEIYNSGRAFAGREQNGEDNAEGIDNVNGSGMKVYNNYIHDICSNAIYAKGGAADVVIENNRIERAFGGGILVGFDTSPEFFDLSVNPDYYESVRCVVRNNLIIDTGWEGVGLYGSKDAQVYNNTLVNVANGGRYHSAIYFGLTYQDWETYAGRPANVNPKIHSNIVSQPNGNVRPMIEIRYSGELGGMSALDGKPTMNSNCYFISGKSAVFSDYRPGSVLENAGLSAWKDHIGGDAGSIEADPALDKNFLPANPLCAGMGITSRIEIFSPGAVSFLADETPPVSESLPVAIQSPGISESSMMNFKRTRSYSAALFADVNENEWYGFYREKSIATAYEHGLMQGSGGAFNPAQNIKLAEAVALAARVRDIYEGGAGDFSQGAVWYQTYVDYAAAKGIIKGDSFNDFEKAATRAEMALIFSRALPEEEFKRQNEVNSLPDVSNNNPYRAEIFALYEAGILTGSDDRGLFNPDGFVTRAEAAAIISRVILPGTRASGRVFN